MNPHGGSGGEANANNQNYLRPRFSSETQDRLRPLFPLFATEEDFDQPEVNFPQQGGNNIGATTDVPLEETPNVVAPESNIYSSSSFAGTSPNPEENVDLYLNFGMSGQGETITPAMVPSSNVALSAHGSDSSSVNISRKRSLPENASPNIEEPKRFDTRSQVRATRNEIPHIAETTVPPTNMRADWMDNTDHRIGSHAQPFISTHSLHSSFQPSLSVEPLSFHSTSFMSGPAFTVNTMTNAPHSISSGFPHAGLHIMAPFYQHGNNMFGPVVTSMGNFPTYRPNRFYVDTHPDTSRRALSFVLPHTLEPPLEPLHLLPGIVGNGNTYHPLSGHASSSSWVPPQGSRGMNHFAAVSSPGPLNHLSLVQTSSSAIPPNFIHEPAFPLPQFPSEETRRRLPNGVQSILNSLGDGHALRFEELMILDYSLVLRAFQIEHPELFETSRFTGLSLETITQYMERQTFLAVDGDDSEQNKERCPVCLEEFCNGEDIGKLHSCVHKFHFDCIKTWLNHRNRCPVCRKTGLETSNEQNVGGKAADAAVVHDEGDSQ
ncbi:probable E3 ubiquitin-protein ligase HIP1 [Vigna umbellata]|uniref:probable E3 ubiquitin-protein ligase HIP1 n=1 Tax=Vigna umbellata TaxID=87088 RepID=UPI001F5FEE62|nr:probable E3 ubiquitin-protein ligase HIP1 [Vigna umbellata]